MESDAHTPLRTYAREGSLAAWILFGLVQYNLKAQGRGCGSVLAWPVSPSRMQIGSRMSGVSAVASWPELHYERLCDVSAVGTARGLCRGHASVVWFALGNTYSRRLEVENFWNSFAEFFCLGSGNFFGILESVNIPEIKCILVFIIKHIVLSVCRLFLQLQGLKMIIRWLLGLKSSTGSTVNPTLRLLYSMILSEGDLTESKRIKWARVSCLFNFHSIASLCFVLNGSII